MTDVLFGGMLDSLMAVEAEVENRAVKGLVLQ